MPQHPSEPEKYSVDEMMERLKNRPAQDPIENGKLVTRADGSQAIRVRKRKRRSHQPHKEQQRKVQRSRMIQISAALILLLLALLSAGAAIAFANSAPFRQALVNKISRSSGAKTELTQFRMNPATANAGRLSLSWPEGNALSSLSLSGINAKISPASFLGNTMSGEDVTCAEGTLTLRIPKADAPLCATPRDEAPLFIRFQRYAVPTLHIQLGESPSPLIRLKNTEAAFYPAGLNGRAQLLLNRGDIHIQGWPKLRLDRSHVEFRDKTTDIVSLRLLHESDNRGFLEFAGSLTPYSPDHPSTLVVRLESFLTSGIVGEDLGRFFSGRIDSMPSSLRNNLTFSPTPDPDSSLTVEFRSSPNSAIKVSKFPFLSEMARILDDNWFEAPKFDDNATGTIRRSDGKAFIGDLHLETKGRMALRGNVAVAANRSLSGTLELGVADAMIEASADARLNSMFSRSSDGFRWVSLKIGGTGTVPTDDFKALYNKAAAAEGTSGPSENLPSFEDLTRPR